MALGPDQTVFLAHLFGVRAADLRRAGRWPCPAPVVLADQVNLDYSVDWGLPRPPLPWSAPRDGVSRFFRGGHP